MAPIQVKPRKADDSESTDFYSFVRHTLLLCRCAGLLPISGLFNRSSESTRGKLKSWYILLFLSSVVIQGIGLFFIIYYAFEYNHQIEAITKCVFTLAMIGHFSLFLFMLRFSCRWEAMIKDIKSIERLLPATNYHKIITRIHLFTLFIFILALGDNIMFYTLSWKMTEACYLPSGNGKMDVKTFFKIIYSWIFDFLPINYVFIILFVIVKLQILVMWTCADILIITTSVYLSSQFDYFNHLIDQKEKGIPNRATWRTLQVHYTHLSRLVTVVDDYINPIVFLSYATNLILLCLQLFHITNNIIKHKSLKDESMCMHTFQYNTETVTYQVYNCIFITIRTICVSHFASRLHLVSRKPLDALHTFSSSAFSIDMQRLMNQVYHSHTYLTGSRLFRVSRGMVLIVVFTLITYELVLFQL